MPTPRRLLSAAAFKEKIYTFGGCGSPCFEPPVHTSTFEETLVEVYDPGTNSWSRRKPIPAILFGAAAVTVGKRIYLFGGVVTGNATYAYDPRNDTWQRLAPMPTSRHGMAAVTVKGKVYVLGGSTGAAASNALEMYDPENNRWERGLAPMPTARVFLAAAVVGGKIYAIGGSPDCCGKAVTNAVEVYDPEKDEWRSVAPLLVAQQVSAAAAVDGRIYVLGGFIPGSGAQGGTFEYDPAAPSNPWRTLTAMPEPRDQAPAVVLEIDEKETVHILGGSVDCHCRALGTHSSYSPPSPAPTLTADLQIRKEIRPGEVLPGQRVRYTITATNAGPDPVTDALVTDDFPEELNTVTWTCVASPGARCAPGPVAGAIADRVNLLVGSTVTYTVDGVLDREASGTLENTARIEPPNNVEDPRFDNNTSTVTRTIGECIEIDKTDGRDDIAPGGGVLYRITVRNDCPAAMPVIVTDDLSAAGLKNVRWCRGQGCTPSIPGDLVDDFELPSGGTVIYQVGGTVPCECELRSITNTACVELSGGSTFCASDTNQIVPEPGADLALDLVGPKSVCAGDMARYTITVINQGLCTAKGVEIQAQLPSGFEIVEISSPSCAQGLPCEPGDIAPGTKVEVAVTLKAPPVFTPPAAVTVSASVTSGCDPVAPNNMDSVPTEAAQCSIDLAITKSNGLDTAAPGDAITYTIVVENLGESAVTGARVEDVFPAELEQLNWCRGLGCAPNRGGNLVDTLDLPALGKETYIVEAVVSPMFAGTLSNTATVSPPQGVVDAVPGNNSSTDTDEILPAPGVTAICKEITGTPVEGGMITKVFVLWNGGPEDQADNPGDEFVDTLPPGLTLVSAVADSGVIIPGNPVRWNGAIPANAMVTIRITAMIDPGTAGQTICNLGTVSFDGDGDGVNESMRESGPCCVRVLVMIPVLTGPGAAVLVLLLALMALARMRRGTAV
ncbi:MAG TPA: kelch repeat-containing protein [Thermoanaerobaculia bacterium]